MQKLQELAELAGISSSYVDKTGKTHYTTDEVRRFFLKNMGYAADTEEEIENSLQVLKKQRLLPPVMSFYENEKIEFYINGEGEYELLLKDEVQNTMQTQKVLGGQKIRLSGLKFGYYTVLVQAGNLQCESFLIYAPQKCWQPEFLQKHEHIYGTAVMLYALHSEHSMGIGDFGDLTEIVKLTAQNGGDVVGINPLGVMSPFTQNEERFATGRQSDVSPYRTLSRLFVNYIYLDLPAEEDFKNSALVQAYMNLPETKEKLARLNAGNKVEYAAVLLLKKQILEMMFQHFESTASAERKKKFAAYIQEKGVELENLAIFETLLEKQEPADYWRFWPEAYKNAKSPEINMFKHEQQAKIKFYQYCHWLADKQIKQVQKLAVTLKMKLGLYTDMPIGAASNGAEVWENSDVYVLDAGIGAPADPMRPRGQSWGFTPYHPQRLEAQHYAPFIKLVQENMQYSGALRIDHAMGLRRLFWGFFAKDNPVVQGAYVYYNIKDLVAILCLESNRRRCLVIGEDLGTVPEGFREYMAEHNLLSYKVFCRQKEKNGSFIAPEKYMYLSLAQPSTHDQATACGFWKNEDIEVFNRSGLYVNHMQYLDNLEGRRSDRENMLKAFEQQRLISVDEQRQMQQSAVSGTPAPEHIQLRINEYCASTNSAVFLVRLNDIYRQQALDNAPGTVQEYPNWRIKMSVSIEQIKQSKEFAEMMRLIKTNRPHKGE